VPARFSVGIQLSSLHALPWWTMNELQDLLKQQLLTDRCTAMETLAQHGWLLSPDVRVSLLTGGQQGIYRGIELGPEPPVDFLVYEMHDGQAFWQLTRIASPTDAILHNDQPSTEFQHALDEVSRWHDWITRNDFAFPSRPSFSTLITFRIVIGQSQRQTADERNEVQRWRRGNLRIRSFDWLLEKPTHYSPAEIAALEQFGQAKSAEQFEQLRITGF
jgi:hypothetical protein